MKTCTNCQRQGGIGSWVDNRWTCSDCYKLTVAQVLAARRKPAPTGPPVVIDRSPMPATADVTEGDYYFRVPFFDREPKPPARRKPQCAGCGEDLPRRTTDRFRSGGREYCTLTCLQA